MIDVKAIAAIALDAARHPLTRRAAEEALVALIALDRRLVLDTGVDTHVVELAEGGHTARFGRDPREAP